MKKEIFICDICDKQHSKEALTTFHVPFLCVYNNSSYSPIVYKKDLDICSECANKIAKYIIKLQENKS